MIIAIDIRHLATPNPSGVGHYTINLINQLAQQAPTVRFLLFAAGTVQTLQNLPQFNQTNVEVIKKEFPNRLLSAFMLLPTGKTLESFLPEQPDAWLFPNINYIRTDLPYAITAHDLSFEIFPEFFSRKQRLWHRLARARKLYQQANRILAVSESTKLDLVKLWQIPKDKITVTHLGVDERFTAPIKPQDKTYLREYKIRFPYLLTLSTLEPRKNLESVVEAYDAWRTKSTLPYNQIPHLVIAGGAGWKNEALIEAIEHAQSQSSIHLLGYVADKHRPALLRNAAAFLFPSYYEGFGLPALEALSCGTPVITSFTGSMPEVVENAAIMVDPYDVSDLEQALNTLTEPGLSGELSQRGLKQAQKFTWPKTAQKTLEVLQKIVTE